MRAETSVWPLARCSAALAIVAGWPAPAGAHEHLPVYGVMAVLLVWTAHAADQRLWTLGVLRAANPRPVSGAGR